MIIGQALEPTQSLKSRRLGLGMMFILSIERRWADVFVPLLIICRLPEPWCTGSPSRNVPVARTSGSEPVAGGIASELAKSVATAAKNCDAASSLRVWQDNNLAVAFALHGMGDGVLDFRERVGGLDRGVHAPFHDITGQLTDTRPGVLPASNTCAATASTRHR